MVLQVIKDQRYKDQEAHKGLEEAQVQQATGANNPGPGGSTGPVGTKGVKGYKGNIDIGGGG